MASSLISSMVSNYKLLSVMKKIIVLLLFCFLINIQSAKTQNYVAAVLYEDYWGYIDEKGNYVLQPMYDAAQDFSSGMGMIKNLWDWYYVNKDGVIINSASEYITRYGFSEGMARIELKNRWGFIDRNGEIVIQPQFVDAGDFKNGVAPVRTDNGWGYIDKSGNYFIEPQFKDAKDFENSVAKIKNDDGWVFINSDKKIFPQNKNQYDIKNNFSDGMAFVVKDRKFGFINTTGELVIPARFDDVGSFNNGFAPVEIDRQWGYINKSGDFLVNPKYKVAQEFKDDMAMVRDSDGYLYITTSGEEIGKTDVYEVKYAFSDGYARVIQDGRWGFIDKTGKLVIPAQFDKAEDFSNGLAPVLKDGSWGYINKNGDLVIDYQFRRAFGFIKI